MPQKIEGLDALVNLEELWLGKNKITTLENLSSLGRLKILALQSNRITKIEGLEHLESLEELYLSHNGLERLEGVDKNVGLRAGTRCNSANVFSLDQTHNARCG